MWKKTILTVALETVVGFVSSIVGGLAGAMVASYLPLGGSCQTPGIVGIFIAAPLSCAAGISVIDGVMFGFKRLTVPGLVLALVVYGLGMYLSLEHIKGNAQFVIVAAALAFLSAVVYRVLAAWKKEEKRTV